MTTFYDVGDNSIASGGLWIQTILVGLLDRPRCSTCGAVPCDPVGDLLVALANPRVREWPDAIGCGHWPLFCVSKRVVDACHDADIAVVIGGKVGFSGEVRAPQAPPAYYWVDGSAMLGAKMDFEASGYVDVRFCPECGRRTNDISATYDKQHKAVWPQVIREETWNGSHIFTTDLSDTHFFCTQTFLDAAVKHRLRNLRFILSEQGSHGEPVKYLSQKQQGRTGGRSTVRVKEMPGRLITTKSNSISKTTEGATPALEEGPLPRAWQKRVLGATAWLREVTAEDAISALYEEIDRYRKARGPRSRAAGTAASIGCRLAVLLARELGWTLSWGCSGSSQGVVVASIDRRFAVFTVELAEEQMRRQDNDITIKLMFNMLRAGNLPEPPSRGTMLLW